MARRNIWEDIYESTEGPNVTLELPREVAEQLLSIISGALEIEDDMGGGDGMDDGDMDLDDMGDMGGMGMDPPGGDMPSDDEPEFGEDDPFAPAGDDSDDEPPKPKAKKKDGGGEKKKDKPKDDDKKDKKESAMRLGAFIPSRGRR